MAEPGFWDRPDEAQKTVARLKRAKRTVEEWGARDRALSDIGELLEMADEASDGSVLADLARELDGAESKIAELELQSLLSGEHDRLGAEAPYALGALGHRGERRQAGLVALDAELGEVPRDAAEVGLAHAEEAELVEAQDPVHEHEGMPGRLDRRRRGQAGPTGAPLDGVEQGPRRHEGGDGEEDQQEEQGGRHPRAAPASRPDSTREGLGPRASGLGP